MGFLSWTMRMFGFRPGRWPEPPPKALQNVGMAPGFSTVLLPSMADVAAKCVGADTGGSYNAHDVAGCTTAGNRTIYLTSSEGPAFQGATQAHENVHSWGIPHLENGKGWGQPDPKVLGSLLPYATPDQKAALQAYVDPSVWQAAQDATTVHFPASMMGAASNALRPMTNPQSPAPNALKP